MSEINVTPFVDVMLVLLVIFMVAAPLLTVGVPVNLPHTNAPPINEPKQPIVITVDGVGRIFVANAEVSADALVPRLQDATKADPDAPLYVRGDRAISYGRVLQVMSLISAAGFHKVALVAEGPQAARAPAHAAPGARP